MPNERPPGFVPGYMKEDLELKEAPGGPPRYRGSTDKAIEYIALADGHGVVVGYFFANDEDDCVGFQHRPATGVATVNLATPWVLALRELKARGLSPTQALAEMLTMAPKGGSQIVAGSLQRAASPTELKQIAGDTGAPPTQGTPRRG